MCKRSEVPRVPLLVAGARSPTTRYSYTQEILGLRDGLEKPRGDGVRKRCVFQAFLGDSILID